MGEIVWTGSDSLAQEKTEIVMEQEEATGLKLPRGDQ